MLTIITGVMLTLLAGFSVYMKMEGVASACVGGIMAILSTYIWGETRRPSGNNSKEPKNPNDQ